jgi:Domain of unknown function (DUF4062)
MMDSLTVRSNSGISERVWRFPLRSALIAVAQFRSMSYEATVHNVFIASPSDVRPEREIARQVIYEWNAAHAVSDKAVIQPIGWETHSSPEMGERPQEIINRLVIKSDILVAIFWSRLGSPTGVTASGTIEEIEKHLGAKKPTMIYFSNALLPHDVDTKQFEDVRKLRKKYESEGLIGTFANSEEFRRCSLRIWESGWSIRDRPSR